MTMREYKTANQVIDRIKEYADTADSFEPKGQVVPLPVILSLLQQLNSGEK